LNELEPLRDHPERSALVLDIDGTLAPITATPERASVPHPTRDLLADLNRRYELVACLSGRRAVDARQVVGLDTLLYAGNHGLEYLQPGAAGPETVPEAVAQAPSVRSFANAAYTPALRAAGIRIEDKQSIWAFHWRGAADEVAARGALEEVAESAANEGLVPHWGRKVLEIRPAVAVDKGSAIERLLGIANPQAALYGGDDTTDLAAFRRLREMKSSGRLEHAICVGVRSEEGPADITAEADLVVDGPDGFRELLSLL
jgi:trehalose 6-phosphate phosphatase